VLDLPQLYEKPSGTDLVKALALLSLQPRTFGTSADVVKGPAVQPAGVTRYLTSIISSPLAWLETDELREAIWDAAAARLSERSGRTGMYAFILLLYSLTDSLQQCRLCLAFSVCPPLPAKITP
jgi:hypothetical protein